MSIRPVRVVSDGMTTDQLCDRMRTFLEVGTRLGHKVEPFMESEMVGAAQSKNKSKSKSKSGKEKGISKKETEAEKKRRLELLRLEQDNPQPRLPDSQKKCPVGPIQSQELPRREASPGRTRPGRKTLGVELDFEQLDQPENKLTGEEIERAADDGKTYVQALRDDKLDVEDIKNLMSAILEHTNAVKEGKLTNDCQGSKENMRRGEVLFAVEAVRTKLNMLEWPLDAVQKERYEDFCAFEAITFLASPNALVQSRLSISRAKLRQQWGQRELCGWIDTVLLCVRPMDTVTRNVSGLFLTSCNQSHIDIIGHSGYAALGNNISQAFSNAITLSKMYMFVEELILANSYSGSAMRASKDEFEKRNDPICVQIEKDGALGYVWAAMLHYLVTGRDIDPNVGIYVSDGGPPRYKKYMVGGNATGDYIWKVYELAKGAWWVDTLLLAQSLYLINEENAREYDNASTYKKLTASTNVRSCLSVAEAESYFEFSKASSVMKVVWAKTWAITVCVSSALATATILGVQTASTVAYYTSLAVGPATALFTAAPVTTTVVGTGVALATLNQIRSWSPSVANYIQSMAGNATASTASTVTAAADTAARQGVRSGAGYAAQSATAYLNAMAGYGALLYGGNRSNAPQFNTTQARVNLQNTAEGNEGYFAAAGTFFAGLFVHTTFSGLRNVPAGGLMIGRQLRPRDQHRGGAATGDIR